MIFRQRHEQFRHAHCHPSIAAAPNTARVLVVDDNVDAAETLAQLLEVWGCDVQVVHDGPAAIRTAIAAVPTLILLDNFSVEGMQTAVVQTAGRARLEASGGITLDNLPAVSATGVDFVSLGALTHSAGVLDFSLEFVS